MKRLLLYVAAMSFALVAGSASAALVTVNVTAEVNTVDDPGNALGTIEPGTVIAGTYTYDDATPDSDSTPEVGSYKHPLGSPVGFDLSGGGHTFTADPNMSELILDIVNFSGTDGYHVMNSNLAPLASGATVFNVSLDLYDPIGTAFDDTVLTATPPTLSDFSDTTLNISGQSVDGSYYSVTATVQSLGIPVTFSISPASGSFDAIQEFDLALIFSAGEEPTSPFTATLNGMNISSYLNGPDCYPGAPNDANQVTWVCSNFGSMLGSGDNFLSISAEMADGTVATETVDYTVIGY